jgi:hypothetical protein
LLLLVVLLHWLDWSRLENLLPRLYLLKRQLSLELCLLGR